MIDAGSPLPTVYEARRQAADTVAHLLESAPGPVRGTTRHLAKAQGKGVRALLLLHAAADSEGRVPPDAIPAAAAIELFHMATLVHDDVIDDAPLRRGIPTVQQQFGRKQAVICGDYLLCAACSLLTALEADYGRYGNLLATFTQALSRTCTGELRQLQNNRNLGLNVLGYLRIVSGKTAALFYVSALAGALIARCEQRQAMRMARFGRYLGMVFQIIDDCKDYEFSEGETLKTSGKDIAEGVVTLPLVFALQSVPGLCGLAKEAFDDAILAKQLVKAVRGGKGTEKSRDLAARYAGKAGLLLKGMPGSTARSLTLLLKKSLDAANVF